LTKTIEAFGDTPNFLHVHPSMAYNYYSEMLATELYYNMIGTYKLVTHQDHSPQLRLSILIKLLYDVKRKNTDRFTRNLFVKLSQHMSKLEVRANVVWEDILSALGKMVGKLTANLGKKANQGGNNL